MRAKEIFSKLIMPLKPSDTGSLALQWMEDFGVNQLPMVKDGSFLGLVKAEDILNRDDPDGSLDSHSLPLMRIYVYDYQHFYEVLRLVSSENLSLIAVLNDENKYIGCITLSEITSAMAHFTSVQQPGGILVLEVGSTGYSMSEISRIVESNDAKVLSAFITSPPDSSKLEITVKVSVMDLSSIIQTFNRYDYIIKASFAEESSYDALLSERYASLIKYLNT